MGFYTKISKKSVASYTFSLVRSIIKVNMVIKREHKGLNEVVFWHLR